MIVSNYIKKHQMAKISEKILLQIKENPILFAKTTTVNNLVKILKKLSESYHNTETSIVSDKTYDEMYDTKKSSILSDDTLSIAQKRSKIAKLDNDRYPEIRWTTVKDVLSKYQHDSSY